MKICSIGSVTTDIILSPVNALPEPGTLQKVEHSSVHVGGCASNAAIDLAKLGVPVLLCCKVGKDAFGDFVQSSCASAGVDTSGIIHDDSVNTTTSVVCVNSKGERSFLYNPGSTSCLMAEELPYELIDECGIVFVAGAMLNTALDGAPCAEFFEKMRKKGKMTVMDTAWDFDGVWLPKIRDALEGLDLFMPSYDEAVMLTGEKALSRIADKLFSFGVKSVIIKNGKDGAYLAPDKNTRFSVPAYSGVKVVDTTGAGDSFCAGFLCGIANGFDFEKSAMLGCAAGAHCIQAIGASDGIPPLETVLEFMRLNPIHKRTEE